MERRLRIASAPINWGVGPVTAEAPSPEAVLDAIAEAGYEGCELGTFGYLGATPEQVLARFRSRGLALVTTWHEVDLARPLSKDAAAELRTLTEFLAAGGSTLILISDRITDERLAVVGRVEVHPATWWNDVQWRQARETLLAVAEVTAERGIAVAVHPHVGGHVESGPEIERMLDLIAGDPIGLCVDTGHILIGGGDPIALLERECARLAHVHAKDVDGPTLQRLRAGAVSYADAVAAGLYSELGAGIVDWPGFQRGLAACGYAGWVVAEQDRALVAGDPRPFESNRRNREFLRKLLNA